MDFLRFRVVEKKRGFCDQYNVISIGILFIDLYGKIFLFLLTSISSTWFYIQFLIILLYYFSVCNLLLGVFDIRLRWKLFFYLVCLFFFHRAGEFLYTTFISCFLFYCFLYFRRIFPTTTEWIWISTNFSIGSDILH